MKKSVVFVFAFFIYLTSSFCQSVVTANDFFNNVSDNYSNIQQLEADVEMTTSSSQKPMTGKISLKRPEMFRIDFVEPKEQVILFNGDDLVIYLPGSSAVLKQSVENDGSASASATQGLSLFKRYYTISYEVGQEPVPLDDMSDEKVINLLLYRRTSSEAFSTILISVNPQDLLIRRVVATNPQNEKFTLDITNYNLNVNLNPQRFLYDPPSSANEYNNFLFSE